MPNVSSLLKQLKQERDRVANQLSGMDAALRAFAGVYSGTNGKRQISAAGRKRIAAAQRARWAKVRGKATVATPKRTMSASLPPQDCGCAATAVGQVQEVKVVVG